MRATEMGSKSIGHGKESSHSKTNTSYRIPCDLECNREYKEHVVNVRLMNLDSDEDWPAAQRSDTILSRIIAAKEAYLKPSRDEISTINGKTMFNLIVVPPSKTNGGLKQFTVYLVVARSDKYAEKVKAAFYWVGCQQDVTG
ncbi:hypothetical protein EVAR_73170_1 [Eumeta japonica]|uniref:Uncharacterized protein n=1 Tax=Eumeta variegata TaxID=151549 RepID=A0A4C1SLX7_EUMVA|nr:hypothetical protein EVAR_73170_1 [Eumeta japonica]